MTLQNARCTSGRGSCLTLKTHESFLLYSHMDTTKQVKASMAFVCKFFICPKNTFVHVLMTLFSTAVNFNTNMELGYCMEQKVY